MMVTARKILLVLVPPVLLLCLTASYVLLYASPETLYRINNHISNIKIWPPPDGTKKNPPSPLEGEGLGLATATAGGPQQPTTTTLDLPDLRALCARTRWDDDLAVHCHSRCGPDKTSFCGGLSNARDRLQTCLRLAIDAGATAVVIPPLAARSEKRLATVDPAAVVGTGHDGDDEDEVVELCADAWFDTGLLREALGGHCPRVQVRVVCPPGTGTGGREDVVVAARLGSRRVLQVPWRPLGGTKYDARAGHGFREAVQTLLRDDSSSSSSSSSNATHEPTTGAEGKDEDEAEAEAEAEAKAGARTWTTLVEVGDTYMAWDYRRSGEQTTLFKDLFRAVTFNPALRALGQRLLLASSPQLRAHDYVGVHLRGEDDWPAAWGSLEDQARLYAGEVETLRLRDEARGRPAARTLYVSCGNRTAVGYFRARVGPLGYAVLDKWSLLEEEEEEAGAATSSSLSPEEDDNWSKGERKSLLGTIEALSFDEKAVVEYEPLVRGRYFLGISYSSLSFVVATARTLGEPGDFFDVYIAGGGGGGEGEEEEEKGIREVRGNEHTRLIYVNID